MEYGTIIVGATVDMYVVEVVLIVAGGNKCVKILLVTIVSIELWGVILEDVQRKTVSWLRSLLRFYT